MVYYWSNKTPAAPAGSRNVTFQSDGGSPEKRSAHVGPAGAGLPGVVPLESALDTTKFLAGDGNWRVPPSGGSGGGLPSLADLVGTYVYFSDCDIKALNSAPEIAALYVNGGAVEYPTPPIGRVGVIALKKNVVTSQVVLGSSHPAPYILGGGEVVWETCVMIDKDVSEQSSDNAFVARAGLGDTPSGTLSNGVLFELYKGSSTLPGWKLRCTSGGSSSFTPSDNNYVPASNEWVHLKLVVNAAGMAVEGFINNSSIGILDTLIPITGLMNYFQIWTVGGATNSLVTNLNIDWLHVRITPTRAIP